MKKIMKHALNVVKVIVASCIIGISIYYALMLFGAPLMNGLAIVAQLMFNPIIMSYFFGGLFILVGFRGLIMLHRGMKKMMADLKKDYPADKLIQEGK